eukprot:g5170.t1
MSPVLANSSCVSSSSSSNSSSLNLETKRTTPIDTLCRHLIVMLDQVSEARKDPFRASQERPSIEATLFGVPKGVETLVFVLGAMPTSSFLLKETHHVGTSVEDARGSKSAAKVQERLQKKVFVGKRAEQVGLCWIDMTAPSDQTKSTSRSVSAVEETRFEDILRAFNGFDMPARSVVRHRSVVPLSLTLRMFSSAAASTTGSGNEQEMSRLTRSDSLDIGSAADDLDILGSIYLLDKHADPTHIRDVAIVPLSKYPSNDEDKETTVVRFDVCMRSFATKDSVSDLLDSCATTDLYACVPIGGAPHTVENRDPLIEICSALRGSNVLGVADVAISRKESARGSSKTKTHVDMRRALLFSFDGANLLFRDLGGANEKSKTRVAVYDRNLITTFVENWVVSTTATTSMEISAVKCIEDRKRSSSISPRVLEQCEAWICEERRRKRKNRVEASPSPSSSSTREEELQDSKEPESEVVRVATFDESASLLAMTEAKNIRASDTWGRSSSPAEALANAKSSIKNRYDDVVSRQVVEEGRAEKEDGDWSASAFLEHSVYFVERQLDAAVQQHAKPDRRGHTVDADERVEPLKKLRRWMRDEILLDLAEISKRHPGRICAGNADIRATLREYSLQFLLTLELALPAGHHLTSSCDDEDRRPRVKDPVSKKTRKRLKRLLGKMSFLMDSSEGRSIVSFLENQI